MPTEDYLRKLSELYESWNHELQEENRRLEKELTEVKQERRQSEIPAAAPQGSIHIKAINDLTAQKRVLSLDLDAANLCIEQMTATIDGLTTKTDQLRYTLGLTQDTFGDTRAKLEQAERDAELRQEQLCRGRKKLFETEKALEESDELRAELGKAWESSERDVRRLQVQLEDCEAEVALVREMIHAPDVKKETPKAGSAQPRKRTRQAQQHAAAPNSAGSSSSKKRKTDSTSMKNEV